MSPEQHRRTVELEAIIDSDNAAPRCGCSASPWPLYIAREFTMERSRVLGGVIRDVILIAFCMDCAATWEWGEVCATPQKEDPTPTPPVREPADGR